MAGPFPHIFNKFISVYCSVVGAGLKFVSVTVLRACHYQKAAERPGQYGFQTEAAVARKGDTVQMLLVGQVGQVQLEIKLIIFYLALLPFC